MLKKILLLLPILVCYTLSNADTLLDSVQAQTVNVSSQENSATGIAASLVRKSAPTSYTVKKTDTVMKLAQMYLTKF